MTWRPHDQEDSRNLLANVPDLDLRYVEAWLEPIERASGAPMQQRWAELRAIPGESGPG